MDHGGKRYLGGQYVNTSPSRGESPSLADDDDDDDDGAQTPVQISRVVSLVLLVLLIIPLSVEKSDLVISHLLSFQVSHV